jgi:HEAT repeat protein
MQLDAKGSNEAVVPALHKLLQDENAEVRETATNALRSIGEQSITNVVLK